MSIPSFLNYSNIQNQTGIKPLKSRLFCNRNVQPLRKLEIANLFVKALPTLNVLKRS